MKKMITIISAFILLATASASKAQTITDFKKMTVTQKARFISDSLKTNLGLSPKQYDKVYTETLAGIQKIMPAEKAATGQMEKRQQMRAFMAEEEPKLKAILTAQQFAVFQAKKQKAILYYMQHMQDQKIVFNVPNN